MLSIDAQARRVWNQVGALRQNGRTMVEHVNECVTVKNQFTALGETVPEDQFIDKLLNMDRDLSYLCQTLAHACAEYIITRITDGYSFHDPPDRQQQQQQGDGGRGRL